MDWVDNLDDVVLHPESPTSILNISDIFNSTMASISMCPVVIPVRYESSLFQTDMAVPEWEAIVTAITLFFIIIVTIVGNVLVILSVFSYPPLRIVQNFFIVSLAVADLTVAIFVLPFNVVYAIHGRWVFPVWVCKMWLTCDVMCCTASILNLCAIALDRYWAITDPINYAQKRTLKRVLVMIAVVWGLSLLICSPPLVGWNDWPDVFEPDTPCQLNSQPGYVVYSALGSFYIPLTTMSGVYVEIFLATRRRLRERARASKLNAMRQTVVSASDLGSNNHHHHHNQHQPDQESVSSETNHNELSGSFTRREKKRRKKGKKKSWKDGDVVQTPVNQLLVPNSQPLAMGPPEDSFTTNTTGTGSQPRSQDSSQRGEAAPETEHTDGDSPKSPPAPDTCVVLISPPAPKRPTQVYQFIEEKQRISLSKERRAARTLGIIMGVFVVCWLPFFMMYVILPFCPTCCPSDKLINFITWLGYINSALNPIIYTIFNLDFRRAFKKLVNRCFPKCFMM